MHTDYSLQLSNTDAHAHTHTENWYIKKCTKSQPQTLQVLVKRSTCVPKVCIHDKEKTSFVHYGKFIAGNT